MFYKMWILLLLISGANGYVLLDSGTCDQPLTQEECNAYAGGTATDQSNSQWFPPGCSKSSANGNVFWGGDGPRPCGYNTLECVCKRYKCDKARDECITTPGCWWHGDKCTEGCDKYANFTTRECGLTETQVVDLYKEIKGCG